MRVFTSVFIISVLFLFSACKVKQVPFNDNTPHSELPGDLIFGFYNVENLFDTLDHPTNKDEYYLPDAPTKWNTERYNKKLDALSKVIRAMKVPDILGLSEVENASVLTDLVHHDSLKDADYKFIHYESPDLRGIDVALLYKSSIFTPHHQQYIRLFFPDSVEIDYTSRDILYVEGKFNGTVPIGFFVNHWPSRRGGVKESEPKRVFVAQVLRKFIDSLHIEQPELPLVLMGDFNDEPDNRSVSEVLQALPSQIEPVSNSLINCMSVFKAEGKGSYNYRGNWNMLDQFIISSHLLSGTAAYLFQNAEIILKDWMMYEDPKFGIRPSRTYGGPNYYGGYSDHLPVIIKLSLN